jgi:hypothetical protein
MILPRRGLGQTAQVQAIAQAFATAEGGLTPGTFPYRTNNPCDIFVGGSTAGYSSMQDGWNACYNQIELMLSGQSSVYTPDESISNIAASYAPTSAGNNPSAWANNVAAALGLSPSQPLTDVSGGSVAGSPSGATTGLPAPLAAGTTSTDVSGDDLSDSVSGFALTDDSGNITPIGWGAIALLGGLTLWAIAS